ncbi:(2Fe-2S) ferredoxin domain-containing protein [Streptomyces physcomitrii]|uniref:(2Fe-2S) ferredoxin domain-containing protein n=1 Tax=Streptomyces physcomitrii TaxID=2724184 RepID=A0ABX1GZU2_9ACTN|nr:(2Fe-2S) ferredoxin domain-containing protein [Streptomyces physcomitrii]NKI41303.1 (2Fe-2S) ferredoxin domain-containing protein [Streptomyces physcomitrii]
MPTAIRPARGRPCTLVVCRGCCCGQPLKYPGWDHAAQLRRFSAAATASEGRFAVRVTDCLGPCDQANIVVLRPSPEGRRRGGRPAWIGWSMGADCTEEIIRWAHSGGPGLAPAPLTLELQFVESPAERRRRQDQNRPA